MAEFKGTKGKWIVDNGVGVTTVNCIKNPAGIESIALIKNQFHSDNTKANALLISKAPEMLEMLNKHLGILKDIEMESSGDTIYLKNLMTDTEKIIKEATEL